MKKKITTAVAAVLITITQVYAEDSSMPIGSIDNNLISISEKSEQLDINTYPTDKQTEASLKDVTGKLMQSSAERNQTDTAKSTAARINEALRKTDIDGDTETIDKIVNVNDCVKLALANHPSIESYRSNALIYKTHIGQSWSNYFPQIGLDANYSRNDMLIGAFNVSKQTYNMFYLPQVSVKMMLFDFGKTKAQADIARKSYEAAEENVQMSINEVIFNVKKSYYNLLYALQAEKVYSDTVADFELHLKQAEAYYRIGTKAKIDVLTAEYNLGKAKLNLIKSKNTVKSAYANVNDAVGIPEFSGYEIDDNLATYTYNVNFEDMIDTAYKVRPEVLAAQKKSEGSKILIRASKRAFLPDINAFGNFSLGGTSPSKDHGYQFGGGLTYSNFNVMLLKKQMDEAKATAQKDEADLKKTKNDVYLQVKQAYLDLQNSKDSIPVAELAMMQAKEQYDLASGRYKVGLGDAIELKDAENTYRNSQLDYYSVLMNYNISAANLERVTGSPLKPGEVTEL